MRSFPQILGLVAFVVGCSGESSNGVSSADTAKEAYLGLDPHIDKAITLGFQGFNAATSANIAPQTANGNTSGTLTVTGQVDQGKSANKTMHLTEQLTSYSDDGKITYATSTAPTLDMTLNGIPTGTMNGSLAGTYAMSGGLTGTVSLNLTFTSGLEPGSGVLVQRQPGTTHVTGTATSDGGTFSIDITR